MLHCSLQTEVRVKSQVLIERLLKTEKKWPVISILQEINELETKIAEKKRKGLELKEKVKRVIGNEKTSASGHLSLTIHQVKIDVVILTNTCNSLMMEMNEALGNTAEFLDGGYDKAMYFSDCNGSVYSDDEGDDSEK